MTLLKTLKDKKILLLSYLTIAILFGLTLFLAKNVALAPWTIVIVFIGVTITPGFSLARLFKMSFLNDRLGQIILWFSLGIVLSFLLCVGAMLAGLSLIALNKLYPFAIGTIFLAALAADIVHKLPTEKKLVFNWKTFIQTENLIYLLLIILGLIATLLIFVQGTIFRGGDPNFHLSIIRKAYEGMSLAPENLNFIKSHKIHVTYGLPIWHVFLALLARFHQTDLFFIFKTLSGVLTFCGLFIWYWVFNKIFQNRFFSVLSVIFLLLYIFNLSVGYFFTCLPLPDTLATYFLLPLALGLALKYIFDKGTNYKLVILITVLVILMTIIHLTQYFYFLAIIGFLGIVWSLSQKKHEDYKTVLKKIGWVLLATFVIFIPFLAFLELKSHIISKTFQNTIAAAPKSLRYAHFQKWHIYAKYAYLLTPFILIFIKKRPRLTFLLGLMLITPIIYYKPISIAAMKVLDFIIINRLFGSITWHFMVLALIFGFLVLIIDRLFGKIKSTIWQISANFLIVFLPLILIWSQIRFQFPEKIFNLFFSKATENWLITNLIYLISATILLSLLLYVIQIKKPKISDFFAFNEPKNWLLATSLTISMLVVFFSTTYSNLWPYINFGLQKKILTEKTGFLDLKSNENHIAAVRIMVGGDDLVDFIKNNIPQKSVFMVPGSTIYLFPIILDQHMAAYPRTKSFSDYSRIYESKYDLKEKIFQISQGKIEYIVLTRPDKQGRAFFDSYPQYFENIFESQSVIYKVLPQAAEDYQSGKLTP